MNKLVFRYLIVFAAGFLFGWVFMAIRQYQTIGGQSFLSYLLPF